MAAGEVVVNHLGAQEGLHCAPDCAHLRQLPKLLSFSFSPHPYPLFFCGKVHVHELRAFCVKSLLYPAAHSTRLLPLLSIFILTQQTAPSQLHYQVNIAKYFFLGVLNEDGQVFIFLSYFFRGN